LASTFGILAVSLCITFADALSQESRLVGQRAPDFALRSLGDVNTRLSEYVGEVVLVNFWATWCGPCREEMPELNQLYEKYRRAGLVMFGVNMDDTRERAAEMGQTLKISYPLLLDLQNEVSRRYGVETMPLTVLIDREGTIRYVSDGYKPGYEKRYAAQIRELLNE
jgi:peroxiredoxin